MSDYSKYSFGLETSGDDLMPRSSLADVILGAGYPGLWTAY
jgi:hypothetical protein